MFLIGVPLVPGGTSTSVGLELDDCGYEPSAFAAVEADAALIEREDPERNIMHDDLGLEAQHHGRLKNKALQQALQTAVRLDDEVRGGISFCSWPMLVQQHRISLVLQLDVDVLVQALEFNSLVLHCLDGFNELLQTSP